jgi:hypothetical protein
MSDLLKPIYDPPDLSKGLDGSRMSRINRSQVRLRDIRGSGTGTPNDIQPQKRDNAHSVFIRWPGQPVVRPPAYNTIRSGDPPESQRPLRSGRASPFMVPIIKRGRDPNGIRSCLERYVITRESTANGIMPEIRAGTVQWREIEVENPARSDLPEDPGESSTGPPGGRNIRYNHPLMTCLRFIPGKLCPCAGPKKQP